MFYSVTKCTKCVVHVDNVYVISRTVALRDMQIYIFEWYIVIFMCNNFTITISIYIQLKLFVQSPCNFT
jgi:hypothetical protein